MNEESHVDQGLDKVIEALRTKLGAGLTIYQAAKSLLREGWTGLTQTTLLIHAQDIQRELWVEQGVSTTQLVETLSEKGCVTIESEGNAYLVREVERMAREAGLTVKKFMLLRLDDMDEGDPNTR